MEQVRKPLRNAECPPELEKTWYEALDKGDDRWLIRCSLGGGLMSAMVCILLFATTSTPDDRVSCAVVSFFAATMLTIALLIATDLFRRPWKWLTRPMVYVFAVDGELVYLWQENVDDRSGQDSWYGKESGFWFETSDHKMQQIESPICLLPTGFWRGGSARFLNYAGRCRVSAPGRNPWKKIRLTDPRGDRVTYDVTKPGYRALLADKLRRLRSYNSLVDMEFMRDQTYQTLDSHAFRMTVSAQACVEMLRKRVGGRSPFMGFIADTLGHDLMHLLQWFYRRGIDAAADARFAECEQAYAEIQRRNKARGNAGAKQSATT